MVRSHIDQPKLWRELTRCVIVRGWCFEPDAKPVAAIRLRVGNILLAGTVGFFRPDVRKEFPSAPTDRTGFEIRGIFPAGKHEVVIEAQQANGLWVQIFTTTV